MTSALAELDRGWKPWATALVVAAAALAWFRWNPWVGRYLQLMLAYAGAFAMLRVLYRWRPGIRLTDAVAAAILLSALGAALFTALLRMANGFASVANRSVEFDFALAAAFSATLLVFSIVQRDARSRLEHDRQMAELRLSALQAQIEPHFLFNTLANVQQLVRTKPAQADEMLDALIAYLKAAIPDVRTGRSTFGQELARVRAYLAIMQMRMGGRLRYDVAIEDEALLAVPVPPLALLTLVENAVKHGLDPKPGGGTVTIAASRDGRNVRFTVADDGVGFAQELGSGTGLANLKERIATLYANAASLELSEGASAGVEATLSIPAA